MKIEFFLLSEMNVGKGRNPKVHKTVYYPKLRFPHKLMSTHRRFYLPRMKSIVDALRRMWSIGVCHRELQTVGMARIVQQANENRLSMGIWSRQQLRKLLTLFRFKNVVLPNHTFWIANVKQLIGPIASMQTIVVC